ncbi:MAG: hypothetical protein J6Z11_07580, partial [Candidatus Riflebacteria bacterium]|nr:hypothetical protein [Candidatus Riflebacteria bacterium]
MSESENNQTTANTENTENTEKTEKEAIIATEETNETITAVEKIIKPRKKRGWVFYLKVFSVFCLLMLMSFAIAIFWFLNKLTSDSNFEKLVNQKVSEATNMDVKFEKITVSFPSLELKNIHIATDSASMKLDSLIASVKVRPDFFEAIKGNVVIDYLIVSSSTTMLEMKAIKSTDVAVKESKTSSSSLDLNSITFPFKSLDINGINFTYVDDASKNSYNVKLNRASLSHSLMSSAMPYEVDGEWVNKASLNAKGDLYWPTKVLSDINLKVTDINEVKKYVPEEYKSYLNAVTGSNVRASIDYNITQNSLEVKSCNIGVEPLINVEGTANIPQMSPLKLQASATLSPIEVNNVWPIVKPFVPAEYGINLSKGAVGAEVGVNINGSETVALAAVVKPQKLEIATKYVTDNIIVQKGNVTYDGNNVLASEFEVSHSDTSVKLNSLKLSLSDLSLNSVFDANIGIESLLKNIKAYLSDQMNNFTITGNIGIDGNVNGKLSDLPSIKVNGNVVSKLISLIEKKTKAKGTVENLNVRLNSVGAESGTISVENLQVAATGADLKVNGTIKNQKDIGFDCAANGSINVNEFSKLAYGLFNLPVKEGQYKGQLDLAMKLGGTVNDPKPSGNIVAKNIYADVSDYGLVINNFNGTVAADNDKLLFNNIKANLFGGDLGFNGNIKDFKNMKVEAVADIKNADLAMVRKFIGKIVPEMPAELDFSGKADVNASLNGPTSLPTVKGAALIKDGRFIHPSVFRPVEKINGRVNFDNNGLSSNSVTAYWGTSKANVSGSLKDWAKFITNFKFDVVPLDVTDAAGFFLDGTGFKVIGIGSGTGTVTGAIEEIKVDCFAKVDVGTVTAVITEGGDSMKFPFQKLNARATYFNNALDISSASFKLFDGDIAAKAKIHLIASEPIKYDVDANINQLQTQEFLKVNADKKYEKTLVGGLNGKAKFTGDTTGLNSINGDANLAMPKGTYDSPDVIKKIADKLKNPSLASGTIENVSGDYKISNGRISSNNTMGKSKDSTVAY